ncbi:MAG: helix-turn-helix domain-containing protein [Candidatus Pacearchaeota archaeon]
MDNVKRSFDKVKEDMDSLRYEVDSIKKEIRELRDSMVDICEIINNFQQSSPSESSPKNFSSPSKPSYSDTNVPSNSQEPGNESCSRIPTDTQTGVSTSTSTPSDAENYHSTDFSTEKFPAQTDSTDFSTGDSGFESQKSQNFSISTRNQGVPTDKQTNRQTNRQTDFPPVEGGESPKSPSSNSTNSFNDAAGILDSLDNIKKDIRLKFKRLTDQEFLVFSTLYQLADQSGSCDYKSISQKLGLSGSSIRDYIGRLIEKGIPVEKTRLNNKNIQLSISSELKKIVSLPTIMELRDI